MAEGQNSALTIKKETLLKGFEYKYKIFNVQNHGDTQDDLSKLQKCVAYGDINFSLIY